MKSFQVPMKTNTPSVDKDSVAAAGSTTER